ncbi:MAG: GNAT family N-acetyltransferase [Planctomycetota bacterium]
MDDPAIAACLDSSGQRRVAWRHENPALGDAGLSSARHVDPAVVDAGCDNQWFLAHGRQASQKMLLSPHPFWLATGALGAMGHAGDCVMKLEQLIAQVPKLRLRTERLLLRPFERRDLANAVEHEMDVRIMRWIRDPVAEDEAIAKLESWLEPWGGQAGRWCVLVIADIESDAMLGLACFRVTEAGSETLEIGYRLHPDVFRRGYAMEACTALLRCLFEDFDVRRVTALCDKGNEASWRLMEKLGMRREADLREHYFLAGEWRDELAYGLLRREWGAEQS